ncbi:uncharacterized protein LOC100369168 [Saccoglossus kowalevskii]|uniref:Endoglucanase n=1 Tax=Saccoglossus kowalevskii TaxID=10224 RepID=A0ABM0M2C2_SACKO|nr:PREDICTED: endoglucanase 14-like [Saccoglossus kowalevskii]
MSALQCLLACFMLSLIALKSPCLGTGSASCSLQIGKVWLHTYTGVIVCNDVTEDMLYGWTLTIRFGKAPLNLLLWNVVEIEDPNNDPLVKMYEDNKYNAKLLSGESLYIPFKSDYNGSLPEVQGEITLTKKITPGITTPAATVAPTGTTQKPTNYDYNDVLKKSIRFYDAQRSGLLPDNDIPWRESCFLDDTCFGHDLTGGWHDAGDFLKFSYPMAFSVTVLSWGIVDYYDAYVAAGEAEHAVKSLKWATDYLIKCHIAKYEFVYQVGNPGDDHLYWGRPEDFTGIRPCYTITASNPGSEVVGEAAAALAAAALAFDKVDSVLYKDYVILLITHAKELFEFATEYRGEYVSVDGYYSASTFGDELAWAAIWLYRATNEQVYLDNATALYTEYNLKGSSYSFAWAHKKTGVQALLCKLVDFSYCVQVDKFITNYRPGGVLTYTPKGLAYRSPWAPLRYAAGAAFIALYVADLQTNATVAAEYKAWAKSQIHYILGDTGRSYVIGFGVNFPTRPHHRASSCPLPPEACNWGTFSDPGPNSNVLEGALVGGPNATDVYFDDRENYYQSEVACDYNAAFQSAVAGEFNMTEFHSNF